MNNVDVYLGKIKTIFEIIKMYKFDFVIYEEETFSGKLEIHYDLNDIKGIYLNCLEIYTNENLDDLNKLNKLKYNYEKMKKILKILIDGDK